MLAPLAVSLIALCLFVPAARAGIVEQYEASSDGWRAVQVAGARQSVDPCGLARSYDEVMADIDLALVKGQLLLVRPHLRYLDLTEEDRRDLRAFYVRLEQARGEADRRCQR